VEKLPVQSVGAVRTRTTHLLHTPRGDLSWAYEEDEGIETKWDVKKSVTCPEDVEALLSVPFSFPRPPASAYEPFRRHRREMGGLCIGGAGINSMVAMLVGVMDFELVLEWVLDRPDLIKRLADAWLERTWAKVDFLLSQGVGPFWHFNGVERASPPMMGPKQWDELVVPYDGEIMRRIKAADPQARIHVHCHGKVNTLLDSFVSMGVDSTDPVEPPPQGNVDFAAAKKKYKGKLTFFGNIEFLDIETRTPEEIDGIVRRAVLDGGGDNLVLMPSATPHERPSARCLANCRAYIEAGLKYGSW
jgi:uroporphyrinogen-III decarboxylase